MEGHMTFTGEAAASAPAATVFGAPVRQVAMVVADLGAAVRAWSSALGVGPWTAYLLAPPRLQDMCYRGRAVEFSFVHALARAGEVQFELVQPISGPSIFADHLSRHGDGMQHVGIYVADHQAAVDEALGRGYLPLQSARGFGAGGDGAFAYFRAPGVPAVIELISAPKERIEPAWVYPAGRPS
jgi:catechol 2,3-dioxygenase-like lactoylglutathione lyase family enzyme